jgi:cold shock CspA family protein
MQGTVSKFDPRTRAGAVLTDTGIEIPFEPAALEDTPVRMLRPGQRVRLDTTGTGESIAITAVHFITLA